MAVCPMEAQTIVAFRNLRSESVFGLASDGAGVAVPSAGPVSRRFLASIGGDCNGVPKGVSESCQTNVFVLICGISIRVVVFIYHRHPGDTIACWVPGRSRRKWTEKSKTNEASVTLVLFQASEVHNQVLSSIACSVVASRTVPGHLRCSSSVE